MPRTFQPPVNIRWTADGEGLVVLDQSCLPERRVERELRDLPALEEAILNLRVRGAPLIGITAAMGVAALARQPVGRPGSFPSDSVSGPELVERVEGWCERLAGVRPTAVNLGWALERMRGVARDAAGRPAGEIADRLRREAEAILEEDRRTCRRIGEHAVALLRDRGSVITHCNAGALATGGIGTALAPIYVAAERGLRVRVYADETRPLLQGSRLTAWELASAGIDVTVLSDAAAATLMARNPPHAALVGADRIAANGDVANKVGTFGLALAARHHGVPFYVLAPTSTVDLATPSGAEIPIEHRPAAEVREGFGRVTAPAEADVWSPAFDITPAPLVRAIVTEQGIHEPPFGPALRDAVRRAEREREIS